MEEFKFVVERTFTGKVKDTYSLITESKEQAIERFKEIMQSPADMAILPHDTYIDEDATVYHDDAQLSIVCKDSISPFETSEILLTEDNTL